MTALTVPLDDATHALLLRLATEAGVSIEDMAAALIVAKLEQPSDSGVSEEFKAIVAEIIAQYGPLLHRLAQ